MGEGFYTGPSSPRPSYSELEGGSSAWTGDEEKVMNVSKVRPTAVMTSLA